MRQSALHPCVEEGEKARIFTRSRCKDEVRLSSWRLEILRGLHGEQERSQLYQIVSSIALRVSTYIGVIPFNAGVGER